MKKLLLAFAIIGFIATSSFAVPTAINVASDVEWCDDKDCDKKDCKHNKKATASKKACTKGAKACCAKATAEGKKACCSKGTAKSCDKSKAKASTATSDTKTSEKTEAKESK